MGNVEVDMVLMVPVRARAQNRCKRTASILPNGRLEARGGIICAFWVRLNGPDLPVFERDTAHIDGPPESVLADPCVGYVVPATARVGCGDEHGLRFRLKDGFCQRCFDLCPKIGVGERRLAGQQGGRLQGDAINGRQRDRIVDAALTSALVTPSDVECGARGAQSVETGAVSDSRCRRWFDRIGRASRRVWWQDDGTLVVGYFCGGRVCGRGADNFRPRRRIGWQNDVACVLRKGRRRRCHTKTEGKATDQIAGRAKSNDVQGNKPVGEIPATCLTFMVKRWHRPGPCAPHLIRLPAEEILHLGEEPAHFGVIMVAALGLELFEQFALALGQLLRRFHLNLHIHVTEIALPQDRHALAA